MCNQLLKNYYYSQYFESFEHILFFILNIKTYLFFVFYTLEIACTDEKLKTYASYSEIDTYKDLL